jgi:ABC-2 type transport system permease protein
VLPLFLPVAVAVVAGRVAGEAQAGTLRYLLVRPVGRTRCLVAKLVSVMAFTMLAFTAVSVTAYVVACSCSQRTAPVGVRHRAVDGGRDAAHRARRPLRRVVDARRGRARAVPVDGTDSPLAPRWRRRPAGHQRRARRPRRRELGQPYLPTRYWLAFVDLFRDPVLTRDLLRGTALQASTSPSSSGRRGRTSPPRTSPASPAGTGSNLRARASVCSGGHRIEKRVPTDVACTRIAAATV